MALVHLVYNDEAASETFCLFEHCAPGCITCFGGEEDTGLPNVTSAGGRPAVHDFIVGYWVANLFMEAGRWEQLTVRGTLFPDVVSS